MKEGDLVLAVFDNSVRVCKVGMMEDRNQKIRVISIGDGRSAWRKRKNLTLVKEIVNRYKGVVNG